MSFRRDPDPEQVVRDLQGWWNQLDAHDQLLDLRERFGEACRPVCGTCGKEIAARENCAACGDSDDMDVAA